MSFRIELFVIDLDRSIRFYEDALGFVVERSEADYASLRRGDAVLGIAPAAKLPPQGPGPGFTHGAGGVYARLRDGRARMGRWRSRRVVSPVRCARSGRGAALVSGLQPARSAARGETDRSSWHVDGVLDRD